MQLELIQPQSWNDISYNQYNKLLKALLLFEESADPDILDLRLNQVQILNDGYTKEDIGKLRQSQLLQYFKTISFLDTEPVKEIWKSFKIDEKTYELINFEDMSMSQWIDAEKLSIDLLKHNELVAIFYINPDEYSDGRRKKVAEFIGNQPCSKVFYLPSQFFFIQIALEKTTQAYLEGQKKQMQKLQRIIKWSKWINKRLPKWFGSKSSTT